MISWRRPDPHTSFAASATQLLGDLRSDVGARHGQPHTACFKNRELWNGSWERRGATRGIHKRTLVGTESLFAKCAWCERLRDADRELDVEHYRPKVEVTEWNDDPPLPFVSDQPPVQLPVGPGYWWLAFEWTNFSLACKPCNQKWKRNLFPVAAPRDVCVEGIEARELPLLLDPGSGFRTRDHFRWTDDGILEPLTREGRATIITMGLNRSGLLDRRGKVAIATKNALDRFVNSLRRGDRAAGDEAFEELRVRGSRREEFTSMVRWLVEERLQRPWDQIYGLPP